MTMLQILPIVLYAAIVALILWVATSPGARLDWKLPAIAGVLFLLFSLITIGREGVSQFWFNHTINLTGNQVWFDLVMAVAIAFYFIAPRARAVGMPLLPWGIAVAATACIALLPMIAQLLWREHANAKS
jgi:hypothetical protein